MLVIRGRTYAFRSKAPTTVPTPYHINDLQMKGNLFINEREEGKERKNLNTSFPICSREASHTVLQVSFSLPISSFLQISLLSYQKKGKKVTARSSRFVVQLLSPSSWPGVIKKNTFQE